ncbi:MAG: NUDIX hydrolase [Verrucomicrobiota bacterium]
MMPPAPTPIRPWRQIASQLLGSYRIFTLRRDIKISPRTGREHDFFVLDCGPWVNVVAITPDDQMVMVEQYRHGTNTVELEVPGGMIDPHDRDPVAGGLRELREETGYEGEKARIIGDVYANPAILTNVCHVVLVEQCRLKHPQQLDHGEDLNIRLIPVPEVYQLVAANKIKHSLVMVALCYYDQVRRGLRP